MSPELIDLFKRLYEHTKHECKNCAVPYSCCSPEYCLMAKEYAQLLGVSLKETGHSRLPFMGDNGCTVEPHLRPLCTLHTCEINSLGIKRNDPEWTKKYFELRDRIDELSWFEEENKKEQPMDEYVLVKASYDYADEFNCEVMFCGLKSKYDDLLSDIKKWFQDHEGETKEIYVGTNESLEFDSFENMFDGYSAPTVHPITEDVYISLAKIFNEGSDDKFFVWGTGSSVFDFGSWISDESEEEDDTEEE